MPELPEVETTCRGIRPHLAGRRITRVDIRETRLRWPVAPEIGGLAGQRVDSVGRRAKYILLEFSTGTAIVHLGMSGSLRLCGPESAWRRHDHLALALDSGLELRFHDPRRFGCWLWTGGSAPQHALLRGLGPEPLGGAFDGGHLAAACSGRKASIKQTIMDASVVVGVGNIYACEALHAAGIDPRRAAGRVGRARLDRLADSIREVLARSIEQGGTTLRDFLREDGSPGYFRQQLQVYGRTGQPCRACATPVRRVLQGQRSTFFCPRCQK